uniref:Uncharacterized protein n=1 Tax=Junco hyemalis TaxID=40217 RepID=A0A8C5J468_JUNHY
MGHIPPQCAPTALPRCQSLREAIAEHRPLVGKLQRVSAQLLDLSPEQAAPFQRRWQELEEQYGHIRERVRQAAALHWAGPQLSERMDLLLECLERLQSRLQSQPPVRGDAAHLREQIRENSLALGELEKLGVALEGIRAQGEELLATMQAVRIQERTEQLLSLWGCLHGRCQERERWLRELLALAERFWHGLSELAVALSDTQQLVLGLEEAGSEPEALREDIDALQGELDTLGSLGVELMASCGDPDKPDVTKIGSAAGFRSRALFLAHRRLNAATTPTEPTNHLVAVSFNLRERGRERVGIPPTR